MERKHPMKYWLYARKHGRGTRGAAPASDAVACVSDCVCVFFFFFFSRIRADSARFAPQKQAEIRRKRPKSALNMAGKSETCILLSFFVNQGIVCVF